MQSQTSLRLRVTLMNPRTRAALTLVALAVVLAVVALGTVQHQRSKAADRRLSDATARVAAARAQACADLDGMITRVAGNLAETNAPLKIVGEELYATSADLATLADRTTDRTLAAAIDGYGEAVGRYSTALEAGRAGDNADLLGAQQAASGAC